MSRTRPVSLMFMVLFASVALAVTACGSGGGEGAGSGSGSGSGSDGSGSGGGGDIGVTMPVSFSGDLEAFPDFSYDTDWQPAGAPIQVKAVLVAEAGISASGDATVGGVPGSPEMGGEPGTGAYSLNVKIVFQVLLKLSIAGFDYEGPLSEDVDIVFEVGDETTFDPFLLGGKSELNIDIEETVVAEIPLAGIIPYPAEGTLILSLAGTVDSSFSGVCAAVNDAAATYLGETTTSADLIVIPTVQIDVPWPADIHETLEAFDIPVPVPATTLPMDLGTHDITPGGGALDHLSKATVGTCEDGGGTGNGGGGGAGDADATTGGGGQDATGGGSDTPGPEDTVGGGGGDDAGPTPDATPGDATTTDTGGGGNDGANPCTSSCTGKVCGDDGCGGSCGSCATNELCTADGQCQCQPSCSGKECGDDGCGGSCGTCMGDEQCNTQGLCEVGGICEPACENKDCGADGCGGTCGECGPGFACDEWGTCQDVTGDLDCNGIGLCTTNCDPDDQDCLVDCYNQGTAYAQGAYDGVSWCMTNNGCEGALCAAEWCATEVASCWFEVSGDGECGDALDCVLGCPDADAVCTTLCYDAASFDAQVSFVAWQLCLTGSCPEGSPDGCLDDAQANDCQDAFIGCVGVCEPQCDGLQCGGDGCGGFCGECSGGDVCVDGLCKAVSCDGACDKPYDPDASCQCDGGCFGAGDCCADVCTSCGDIYTECSESPCGLDEIAYGETCLPKVWLPSDWEVTYAQAIADCWTAEQPGICAAIDTTDVLLPIGAGDIESWFCDNKSDLEGTFDEASFEALDGVMGCGFFDGADLIYNTDIPSGDAGNVCIAYQEHWLSTGLIPLWDVVVDACTKLPPLAD